MMTPFLFRLHVNNIRIIRISTTFWLASDKNLDKMLPKTYLDKING